MTILIFSAISTGSQTFEHLARFIHLRHLRRIWNHGASNNHITAYLQETNNEFVLRISHY